MIALLPALRTSRFWTDAFGESEPSTGLPGKKVPISVGKRRLYVTHDELLTWWGLQLGGWIGRDGGDEQFPPYPDALRGIEVEDIARAASIVEPAVTHPGAVVALLARFAPICPTDHGARWRSTIDAAFRELGCDPPRVRFRWWDGALLPAFESTFAWRTTSLGMVIEATDDAAPTLASFRIDGLARRSFPTDAIDYPELDGTNFPHVRLAQLIAAARATCEAAITDRSPRTRELAQLVLAGDRDAAPILADHLTDGASPAIVAALRRGDTWPAEIAAGIATWSL